MTQSHFSPDVLEFLRLLARHEVQYLLVGGEAVIYHGYPRLTGDVDFFYDRSPANAERLFAALTEFWQGRVPAVESAAELSEPDLVVQFGRPPNRIDLLSSAGSVAFDSAWARRVTTSLATPDGAVPLQIIGRADLVRTKRDAGRHKDLDDIEHLSG